DSRLLRAAVSEPERSQAAHRREKLYAHRRRVGRRRGLYRLGYPRVTGLHAEGDVFGGWRSRRSIGRFVSSLEWQWKTDPKTFQGDYLGRRGGAQGRLTPFHAQRDS